MSGHPRTARMIGCLLGGSLSMIAMSELFWLQDVLGYFSSNEAAEEYFEDGYFMAFVAAPMIYLIVYGLFGLGIGLACGFLWLSIEGLIDFARHPAVSIHRLREKREAFDQVVVPANDSQE